MTQKKDSGKAAGKKAKQLAAIAEQPEELLRVLIRRVLEEVMEAEMDEVVGAEKGQRRASRTGYRSGHYRRTLVTRVGRIELRVPQDREGRFQTEVFERYQRSGKALVGALAEMYVQGVSTRRVKEITEQLGRARVFGLGRKPDQRAAGRGAGEVRAAAAGGGISVPGAGRALRAGERGRPW